MFSADVAYAIPRVFRAIAQNIPALQVQRPRIVFEQSIVVEADSIQWHSDPLGYTLVGNVVATRGPTTIRAERAELDQTNKRVTFQNGVHVSDPVGTADAVQLTIEFTGDSENLSGWRLRDATGLNIVGKAHEANVKADSILRENDKIVVKDASAWLGDQNTPDFKLEFKEGVVHPGRYFAAKSASLVLGGKTRIPLPYFRQPLGRTDTGGLYPKISLTSNFEPRIAFNNIFEVGDRSGLSVSFSERMKRVPVFSSYYSFSLLPPVKDELPAVRVTNPDAERFTNGYLDDVNVDSSHAELESIGKPRALTFVGTSLNGGSSARPGHPIRLDRDWFVGAETGTTIAGCAFSTQIRFGNVTERIPRDVQNRLELYPSFLSRKLYFGDSVWIRARADAAMLFGDSQYSWVRVMGQIGMDCGKNLQLSAGYAAGSDFGTADFDMDRLYSEHAIHARADIILPATSLSILLKYDFDRA